MQLECMSGSPLCRGTITWRHSNLGAVCGCDRLSLPFSRLMASSHSVQEEVDDIEYDEDFEEADDEDILEQ